MRKLLLRPNADGYTVLPGNEVVSTGTQGGFSRSRRDVLGAPYMISVAWMLDEDGYNYLVAFFNTITQKGSLAFLMDLLVDKPYLTEHECKFVPGSFRPVANTKAFIFNATAQLEVKPLEDDAALDLEIVETYEITNGQYDPLALLAYSVNVLMPVNLQ